MKKQNQPKPKPQPAKVIDFNTAPSKKREEQKRQEEYMKQNPGAPGCKKF